MKSRYIIFLFFALVFFVSCTSDFEELNENPLGLTEDRIDVDNLFTRAIVYGALRYTVFQRSQMLYTQHYIQWYSISVPYFETGRYIYRNDWSTAYWEAAYADFGMQIQQVIDITANKPLLVNENAIARIWKVFVVHRITDFWGDVPYSQAWSGNLTPSYDSQEFIYNDMLNELELAVQQFDLSLQENFGSNDLIYRGNIDDWTRFANSLRLRLAIRISDVAPELARQHGEDVLADGRLIENIEQSATMPYGRDFGNADENVQPMSWITRFDEYRMSNTIIDVLKDNNDPRLSVYADEALVTGEYRGLQNGLNPTQLGQVNIDEFSKDSDIIANQYAPTGLLIWPEVEFLKAEAALKGWTGVDSDPEQYYEAGIRSSMQYWIWVYEDLLRRLPEEQSNALKEINITEQDIQDYIDMVTYNPVNGLEQIITQKWLALINQGFEAWADYRRTGFPVLNPIPNIDGASETGGSTVPVRVRYPLQESVSYNQDNYDDVIGRQGPDALTTRVWWDVD